eukprot:2888455-Pyramimonas_sp.AAC.1
MVQAKVGWNITIKDLPIQLCVQLDWLCVAECPSLGPGRLACWLARLPFAPQGERCEEAGRSSS